MSFWTIHFLNFIHMFIGYARVSTIDQNLNLQTDALTKIGCSKIFTDTISGSKTERPGFFEAMGYLRSGDTLVVWKLDRLGRSLKHLIETISTLQEKGIGFRSLQDSVDTTTSTGKLFFHLIASIAEFERDLIRERTQAGLQAARARGRKGGRPKKLSEDQIRMIKKLYDSGESTVKQVCKQFDIGRTTFYQSLI